MHREQMEGLFHPLPSLFLTLKSRGVSIREARDKSGMEPETLLVNEAFSGLRTAPSLLSRWTVMIF